MSLFGLTFDINDCLINRPMADLPGVYGTLGEGRLADDLLVKSCLADADHGSDSDGHPAGEGHDFDTEGGRPVDGLLAKGRLAGGGHDFEMGDGHLVDDHPADADRDSGMADGRLEDDHPADADHGSDTAGDLPADDHLADDHPAGADHDSDTDARLAGLDCVAVLHVSRYRHHRAHTSCGIRLGWHLARVVDAGHGSDTERGHLVDGRLEVSDHGSGRAHDHLVGDPPAGADHDFEMADDHLVDDLRQDVGYEALRRGCRNYRHADRGCTDASRQRQGGQHAEYGYPDALHRRPSDH